MVKVYPIRPEKRKIIPAVTHEDGIGGIQTVTQEENPLYYRLIKAFETHTGFLIVLNTSLNENKPIVCTPEQAFECFLPTHMDVLVMKPYLIEQLQQK